MSSNFIFSDEFYEQMGDVETYIKHDFIDDYRLNFVNKLLSEGSVLDIGSEIGDFLFLLKKKNRKFYGTDINTKRVESLNKKLGGNYCVIDFRNGEIKKFKSKSIDNVVCTEVIEHIPDDKKAISELCRVSREKVIISVPYKEKLVDEICIHCGKISPRDGHFRSYDLLSFNNLIPKDWSIVKKAKIVNLFLRGLREIFPNVVRLPYFLIRTFDFLPSKSWKWLVVVLEKNRNW